MKEFVISYQAGGSPYWYNASFYAYGEEEALELFMKYRCPYNIRAVKIREKAKVFSFDRNNPRQPRIG